MTTKAERVEQVNKMIKTIANCGRRFFYHDGRYARIEVDSRGKIWWIDDYTEKRIYTHYRYQWRNFSNGGTLRDLVIAFRDYISKEAPIPARSFGPWPDWICNGDLWGYGADMERVRKTAIDIGLVAHNSY